MHNDFLQIYTENDWNDYNDINHWAYAYAKTEAERAAWNWMNDNNTKISFDLIAINPSLVIGKHLNDGLTSLNESNAVIGRLLTGEIPMIVNVALTIVDVRDVAAAHIFMIENEKAKKTGFCTYYYLCH